MSLRELLEEEGSDFPGAEAIVEPDGSTTWSRGGRLFAIWAGALA